MTTPTEKPNIILIFCDDLGYGDLTCYGSEHNRTSRLDQMADEGIRFNDFYVPAPLCTPSRAGLMTGCYPKRVGLDYGYRNGTLFPGDPLGLNPDEITLPRLLKDAGYATKMVGKWHLGDQPEFLPEQHGFDSYFGIPFSNDMLPDHPRQDVYRFPHLPLLRGDRVVETDPNQASLTENYLRECVSFIQENKDGPFFLYFAHMYVHVPIYAPLTFLQQSQNGPYGAAVEHIDHTTGVILDTLSRLGIDENTLVIFTSDNGSNGRQGGSNGPLRGAKGSTWEGGMREPCIARWPGRIPAGRVSSEVATTMDFLPTFSRLAGVEPPTDRNLDGHDIADILLGGEGAVSPYEAFYYYRRNHLNAVRSADWKLHLDDNLLYDLSSDIGEEQNLYSDQPNVVARLNGLADACRDDLGDERVGVAGKNCRPVGKVDNPKPLTSMNWTHPYMQAAYD
ncbi:MAG: Cerebroside-sulfatase [Gemmatimonadetes bacterium]|nr:Cerebroside-sulfatase [Gemmatimonadota bacterium]